MLRQMLKKRPLNRLKNRFYANFPWIIGSLLLSNVLQQEWESCLNDARIRPLTNIFLSENGYQIRKRFFKT
jgi:hypothetical protein